MSHVHTSAHTDVPFLNCTSNSVAASKGRNVFVAQSPPRSQASSAIITPIHTNTHIAPHDSESRNISLAREEEAVLLKHYNIIC